MILIQSYKQIKAVDKKLSILDCNEIFISDTDHRTGSASDHHHGCAVTEFMASR